MFQSFTHFSTALSRNIFWEQTTTILEYIYSFCYGTHLESFKAILRLVSYNASLYTHHSMSSSIQMLVELRTAHKDSKDLKLKF